MKMTLEEARYCLLADWKDCQKCKFYETPGLKCKYAANDIAVNAINYLIIGKRLADESNEKER